MFIRQSQQGTTSVEFAIIAVLLMILLFGIIEMARAMFVWGTINEATRRGARVAVVCPINDIAISRVAVFNRALTPGASPILRGLTPANVTIEYLDVSANIVGCAATCDCDGSCDAPGSAFADVDYVRVGITGYAIPLILPIPGLSSINVPPFNTTLSVESLGVVPGEGVFCNGI